MSEVSKRVLSIKGKLEKIDKRFEKLKQENEELKRGSSDLQRLLDDEKRKTQSVQNEYNRLKLAKTLVSTSGDKAEMKFRVNELVREIDKCIALLNR
ncbi:hypothetical protein G3O08_03410 [Cryomorpha ignava]|uniref:Uncharacterized protein n=1 Tax=Cryomorpha ignava TaxID=101383 RepID=A0A7K3WNH0_9FLAO|nr:hypothetical protein [Cryomorpha ignava]NEN22551.1 hypothetical protein [Cryomorpha ignava]